MSETIDDLPGTDLARFVYMLRRAKVPHQVVPEAHNPFGVSVDPGERVVHIGADDGDRTRSEILQGWTGMFTEFIFNPDGSLKRVGIWE